MREETIVRMVARQVAANAIDPEVPFGAFQPPSGGLIALYKCTDCGHRWHTSWAKEPAA